MFSFFVFSHSLPAQTPIPLDYFTKYQGTQVALTENVKLNKLLKQNGIYIDHGSTPEKPLLYITQEGYEYLLKKNIPFEWIKEDMSNIKMLDLKTYLANRSHKVECLPALDSYPSYDVYELMMFDFAEKYPDNCKIVNLGTLNSGRKILAVQIGDSLNIKEEEPNFLYTSTMHGDELAGFPVMLMLIDHLLCNYGSDQQITNLVNNVNIFINPLANPNGTYRGGNETVLESTRLNAAFVDLNRNFPDPDDGTNPDNNSHQEETVIFMDFAKERNIHLSCNIHSGREYANYPWDTFEHLHADDDWWKKVCRSYADTVQANSTDGYFSDFSNGISNGFIAADISGSRQDYMNYYHRTREFTLELSDSKKLQSDQLPIVWEANKTALINYIQQSLYGFTGTVLDCETGLPIEAEIFIESHDIDNSSVFSDNIHGRYYRFIDEGTYSVTFKAEKYFGETMEVNVIDNVQTVVNVSLCPEDVSTEEASPLSQLKVGILDNKIHIFNHSSNKELYIQLSSLDGKSILQEKLNSNAIDIPSMISSGIYLLTLRKGDDFYTQKIFLK